MKGETVGANSADKLPWNKTQTVLELIQENNCLLAEKEERLKKAEAGLGRSGRLLRDVFAR
jgi:hypothetical protein